MPYKPTGKPPGRPPKARPAAPDGREAGVASRPVHPATPVLVPPPAGREMAFHLSLGELCAECFPDGWQPGWTGIGCPHGSWVRRIS